MDKSDAAYEDRTLIYRALGLFLIITGALLAGAGLVRINGIYNPFENVPFSVVFGLSIGAAIFGIMINRVIGLVIAGMAWAVLGFIIPFSSIPVFFYGLSLPLIVLGIIIRTLNRSY
ncbi:hypothetical protein [Pseudomonas helleri]|uniref:hypothetical protein n=1 Tax=Pseudomonas helleri TaxID=1608996 RepID=UPI003FD60FD6